MLLDEDQIIALTKKQRHCAQAAALNAIGIVYKQRPDGSLIVSAAHVEQALGFTPAKREPKAVAPNWDLIDA